MKHHFATDHVSNTKHQQPADLEESRQKMNWTMHHPGRFADGSFCFRQDANVGQAFAHTNW